jgi:hypothetical protein
MLTSGFLWPPRQARVGGGGRGQGRGREGPGSGEPTPALSSARPSCGGDRTPQRTDPAERGGREGGKGKREGGAG